MSIKIINGWAILGFHGEKSCFPHLKHFLTDAKNKGLLSQKIHDQSIMAFEENLEYHLDMIFKLTLRILSGLNKRDSQEAFDQALYMVENICSRMNQHRLIGNCF